MMPLRPQVTERGVGVNDPIVTTRIIAQCRSDNSKDFLNMSAWLNCGISERPAALQCINAMRIMSRWQGNFAGLSLTHDAKREVFEEPAYAHHPVSGSFV